MVKKYSNFSFTGHFKIFAVISIILIAVGLVSLLLLPFGVKLFNFDIDFLGGTTMQYDLHTDVTADVTKDIEQIVKDTSGSAPSVRDPGWRLWHAGRHQDAGGRLRDPRRHLQMPSLRNMTCRIPIISAAISSRPPSARI